MSTLPQEAVMSREEVVALLKLVSSTEALTPDRAVRRQRLLDTLVKYVAADAGYYCWGRGHPDSSEVTPVAIIHSGFTPDEFAKFATLAMAPEGKRWSAAPIAQRLQLAPLATISRSNAWSDDVWYESDFFKNCLEPNGWDDWLCAVCYISKDTWFNLSFIRRLRREPFTDREVRVVDCIAAGVAWLAPQVSEAIPSESFIGLSPRQRLVMLMLLDGMARKDIATSLGVTLHTINDHVKAVYQRFGINSATELAAKFLQSV